MMHSSDTPYGKVQLHPEGTPGVERIRLDNTEFEGRNSVYVFRGERTVLVDTGLARPSVREQLTDKLADCGVGIADLDAVLLTHWHQDHAGLVGDFQMEGDVTVYAHPDDAGLAGRDPDAEESLEALQNRTFDDWGMPADARAELLAFVETNAEAGGVPAEITPLSDGEQIRAGDETLRAVHTPGHTDGHLCYVRPDGSVLSGDALLPKYTPNVGGADPRMETPLAKYVETLRWIAESDFERAYPGHRDPIDDPASRAREIVAHHRERTGRIYEYLAGTGPADAWTVSAHLFGSLKGIHILHGPGEAHAHLDHLADHGVLAEEDGEYCVVDEELDLDALFPDCNS